MYDFLIEKRLEKESPILHQSLPGVLIVLNKLLHSSEKLFYNYTDHSILHSLDVLNFCNHLLREQVWSLTVAELYVLQMSCYLHDVGMGINQEVFNDFSQMINLEEYQKSHPDTTLPDIIRVFHNECSGLFIRRYADVFDIPSREMEFAIIQISRGHRKTDLYDEKEYYDIETPYGLIRTAYLSALLRLADEIDVGMGRNPEMLYDTSNLTEQTSIDYFDICASILDVVVTEDSITLLEKPKSPRCVPMVEQTAEKIQFTLDYCRDVAQKRSNLRITQKNVMIRMVENLN